MPFAYIFRCADGTFYVGHTDDIASCEKVHNDGFGSRHAAARSPVQVVYSEICPSLRAAVCRKRQLKTWGERKLEALVACDLTSLKLLSRRHTHWPRSRVGAGAGVIQSFPLPAWLPNRLASEALLTLLFA